ncbi:hypothetical protein NYE39_15130 [Janibacter sp. FSL W8-0316]|uniref:phenylacetate--CoA ligase family protein n=1 Tax=Janibacter sp. FSL W8-0316 TaxID=2975325 RepID=UPI0030F4F677
MLRQRRGVHFDRHLSFLMKNLKKSADELARVQNQELSLLLKEVSQYSEFYAERLSAAGVVLDDAGGHNGMDALTRMPVLEKEDLRESLEAIVSSDPARPKVSVTHTSGTTGTPLTVEVDRESMQRTFAEWERYYRWIGLPSGFRSARLSGRIIVRPDATKPPFWLEGRFTRQLFLSTYHMTGENLAHYVRKLNDHRPHLIDGYPSAIAILARYILESGAVLEFALIAVSTTAETLRDDQRADIEKAFGCIVFNQYASSEGAPWIVQCSSGRYHMWTDTGVFEFADLRTNQSGHQVAELVVTSFRARKTPLIRYNIGDLVMPDQDNGAPCPCGSSFPTIGGIVGREEDVLMTRDRGPVGRLDTAFKGLSGILRSKIVQTSLDEIQVLLVVTADFDSHLKGILIANLKDRLGDVLVDVSIVDSIPVGPTGKFKAVECHLPPETC